MTPAATKKTVKKPSASKGKTKSIVIETSMANVADLVGFYKNPRVGDVSVIVESLERNGQYKPIVVNIGTMTKRPNEILVGNHTWLAHRQLGWEEILASYVDVDEDRARRINMVDNKSADEGEYDFNILAELLEDMPDILGTGYKLPEVEAILASATAMADSAAGQANEVIKQTVAAQNRERLAKTFAGAPLGEEPDPRNDPGMDDEDSEIEPAGRQVDPIAGQSSELPGMLQLKDAASVVFDGVDYWGIPRLLDEMLATVDDMPCEPGELESWAGSATKNWENEDQWWLYNWGTDSTSGMKDVSHVIVSFYSFDDYFENWYYYPERYVAKVLNSGIELILTPDWSMSTEMSKTDCLYNLYRARWCGRYFQEAGLKVIPNISWIDGDMQWLKKHILNTLPKHVPVIAMQMQTIDPTQVIGGIKHYIEQVQLVFDTLKPEGAIIYAGPQGRKLLEDEIDTHDCQLWIVGTRVEKLGEQAKLRKKKTTI